ncbi:HotDog domain-containing protein [Hyaloraphidium curvatum]|nr:HotDog domain-containing protein [Hyaloraphidium curvatum]
MPPPRTLPGFLGPRTLLPLVPNPASKPPSKAFPSFSRLFHGDSSPPPPSWYTGPPVPPSRVHADYARRIAESFRRGFIAHLGLRLHTVGPGYCELRFPSGRAEYANPSGVVHGGAVLAALDVAGGKAAYTVLPADRMVVTAQMSSNFLKGARGDLAVARAQLVRAGKNVIVVRGELFSAPLGDGEEDWEHAVLGEGDMELCATALQTLVVVPGRETWSE